MNNTPTLSSEKISNDITTQSGIYKIINKVNGKYYIGSSKHIISENGGRFIEHRNLLNRNKHINPHLQNAWNKYGEDNFDFIITEKCNTDTKTLLELEQRYLNIAKLEKDKCYNISFIAGKVEMTPEIRRKLSLLNSGENHPQYGTHKTEETKRKLREYGKKRIFSKITRERISKNVKGSLNGFYGKHHTIEYKKLSSEYRKNLYKIKENHPRYDKTIYSFINNKTTETFSGTRYQFYRKYDISPSSLCQLIHGKLKSFKEWILDGNNNPF